MGPQLLLCLCPERCCHTTPSHTAPSCALQHQRDVCTGSSNTPKPIIHMHTNTTPDTMTHTELYDPTLTDDVNTLTHARTLWLCPHVFVAFVVRAGGFKLICSERNTQGCHSCKSGSDQFQRWWRHSLNHRILIPNCICLAWPHIKVFPFSFIFSDMCPCLSVHNRLCAIRVSAARFFLRFQGGWCNLTDTLVSPMQNTHTHRHTYTQPHTDTHLTRMMNQIR